MHCISLGLIENALIWLVVLGAVVALVNLILPLVLGPLGVAGTTIVQALKIIVWAAVVIFLIIFIFSLIGCLLGMR